MFWLKNKAYLKLCCFLCKCNDKKYKMWVTEFGQGIAKSMLNRPVINLEYLDWFLFFIALDISKVFFFFQIESVDIVSFV